MKGVLVDTSVWVDHFRQRSDALARLLGIDLVLMHPMILGELACATPPERTTTLADLGRLEQAQHATLLEVMHFVDTEKLFGLGCGLVDMVLLTSTLLTPGALLWTMDKRLCAAAGRFDVLYRP
jgi:hypothetical protein